MDGPGGEAADARVPLVVVSHRGPVRFERGDDGRRRVQRSGGGLVTALLATLPALDPTRYDPVWLCAAATDEDRAVAAEHGPEAVTVEEVAECPVRMLAIDPDEHDRFSRAV